MQEFTDAFGAAFALLASGDPELAEIVGLSLRVTLTAVAISCLVGMPLGALLAIARFPGRGAAAALLNALMGLPPVVVGLATYLLLSRSGPLGALGLLYTPAAMIIAQTILTLPLVAALTRQTIADLHAEHDETLRALGAGRWATALTLLHDGRFALTTAALAGFGRAAAEVGAVMIVGGNIAHATRVMTTAIALETARGELALALGLGMILLGISAAVNLAAMALRARAERAAHV
ncbi:ABC transporter permease [Oceanicella actignis]|uniref:Tungstate transport system permease protein n=1 Tax=Oceanicella actignis TaxID=1189325 RepID=A0A1M7S262_9RHOB|nr:ABC transporter permease [Oceanicella actignis]TYO90167.1 tungstate transport system permease protein [Oceanicella actignis]SES90657.1 tungstate transport system permease protein [Oceanicella actignis]SHN52603.1 tungstate transport system permease protein [Oceanicella actignis]